MGGCQMKEGPDPLSKISKKDFDFLNPLGRGALGLVWNVIHKKSKKQFAIKEIKKENVSSADTLSSVLNERNLLSVLSHPFIVNINFAFQDSQKLYLGLDLKTGGDLRFHMLSRKFSESEIKFIISCLIQGLEYLHSNEIIHKDVKPENIILNNKGYAFLTDFGTASLVKENNYKENSGTPGYMAPEIICRQNHGLVSDFFAIGVILYEVIIGTRPYVGLNRKEIRSKILAKQAKIDINHIPNDWSGFAVDFCNKLLRRKPQLRLGANGIQDVKRHK